MDKYTVIVQLAELVAQARREGLEALLAVGLGYVYEGPEEEHPEFLCFELKGYPINDVVGPLSKGEALYAKAAANLEKVRRERAKRLEKEKAERREQYLKLKAEFESE